MIFSGQTGLRYSFTGIILAASLFAGCIREDRSDCIRETAIHITVQPEEIGGKLTPVEGATVYLFDRNRRYTGQVSVSREEIENHTPVIIPVPPFCGDWVVIWGNVTDREILRDLTEGASMEDVILDLRKDNEGYAKYPDKLFYGISQLSGNSTEEVLISPKTARVNITVKGLPTEAGANDYYFTLDSHYDGYNFTGEPHQEKVRIKLEGEFNDEHDLATTGSYDIIHYPPVNTGGYGKTEQHSVIGLWKASPKDNDVLLASADRDTTGRFIIPQAGKTMNILIYFKGNGEIEIVVVITKWNEVYQWNEW